MKLKVKHLKIETGGRLICLINKEDSSRFDILPGDRVSLHKGNNHMTFLVDITSNSKQVPCGNIGIFEDLKKVMPLKEKEEVEITRDHKPDSIKFIKDKLEGCELNKEEVSRIIKDLVHHHISESEAAYFIAGCYIHGMTLEESAHLTEAIVQNSLKLEVPREKILVDKHSSGGVPNNRTTMLIIPILTASGLTIPKTSSRSITSPSGTADTMEVLAPVEHKKEKINEIVRKVGGCMVWGGTRDLASADDLLIKLEKQLDLDPQGILLASILAKKSAVNSTHILIDLAVGPHAKHSRAEAKILAKNFKKLGKKLRMKVKAIITEGEDIIGRGVGPALEARDILQIFEGEGPQDLKRKSIYMSNILLKMGKHKAHAKELLDSGEAERKFREIIKAQGGNPKVKSTDIELGKHTYEYKSKKGGRIKEVNLKLISRIAKYAGAPHDKKAGLYMHKKLGNWVKKEEPIFTIYAETKTKLEFAKEEAEKNNIFSIRWI